MATVGMQRATVMALKRDRHRCTRALILSRQFEPCEDLGWPRDDLKLSPPRESEWLPRYLELEHTTMRLLSRMGISAEPALVLNADPLQDLAPLEESVQDLLEQFERQDRERDQIQRQIMLLERQVLARRGLMELGVSEDLLRRTERLVVCLGWVSRQLVDQLVAAIEGLPGVITPVAALGPDTLLLAMGLPSHRVRIEGVLVGAGFQSQDIGDTSLPPLERLPQVLEEARSRALRLAKSTEEGRRQLSGRLRTCYQRINMNRLILECQRYSAELGPITVFQGWVPETGTATLEAFVAQATEGRYCIEWEPVQLTVAEEPPKRAIPILHRNPLLVQPFQRLVKAYGEPIYGEVDPTPVFALSFLIMFGMMFGDIGQGAVLALMGYGIFRALPGREDFGILLMECGCSSMLFGTLYGNLFGLELEAFPPLWFRPMSNVSYFLTISLVFGMGMISIGFVLNLVNAVKRRAYAEAVLGKHGLTAALLYWLLAGLAIRGLLGESVLPAIDYSTLGIAGVLLLVLLLHQPLQRWVTGKRPVFPQPLPAQLLESALELMDAVARYVSNTVSFLRVAAFALMHVALFMVIFTIADLLAHGTGGTLFYWLTLVVGNILVITVEGIIVTIQILRLEYYEFFSKFYSGIGRPFRPMGSLNGPQQNERSE